MSDTFFRKTELDFETIVENFLSSTNKITNIEKTTAPNVKSCGFKSGCKHLTH